MSDISWGIDGGCDPTLTPWVDAVFDMGMDLMTDCESELSFVMEWNLIGGQTLAQTFIANFQYD